MANDVIRGVAGDVASPPEPDEAEIEERKGMASDSVPERYVDAWARFQLQRLRGVTEQAWRQAIDDAGRILAQSGALADSFGWLPGDLFDVPRDGIQGGLAWFLEGEAVRSLGPEHAVMQSGRVFDRLKNNHKEIKCPARVNVLAWKTG